VSDPDILRAIGRLEKAFEEGQKDLSRRLVLIEQKAADTDKLIARLGAQQEDFSRRLLQSEGRSAGAMRAAETSHHELRTLENSVIQHVAKLEAAFNASRVDTDARLTAQDRQLAAIRGDRAESEKRFDKRLAVAATVIVALVPVMQKLLDVVVVALKG
jgi:hypothetical protein